MVSRLRFNYPLYNANVTVLIILASMRPPYTMFNYSGSSTFSTVIQFALFFFISLGCQALQHKEKYFLQLHLNWASESFVPDPRSSCSPPFISSEQKA